MHRAGTGNSLTQVVSQTAQIPVEQIFYCPANTSNSPNSGTTSGSRQTLITGEAARRACEKLYEDLKEHSLQELEGREYQGEYLAKTDKMGSDVPNPVSHVAYGYATQVCILNEDGTIQKMVAAHDVGKAVNPISVEGQIEGGVVMGMGYALTEQYEIKEGRPVSRFGTLGLFRADKVPDIQSLIMEKPGSRAWIWSDWNRRDHIHSDCSGDYRRILSADRGVPDKAATAWNAVREEKEIRARKNFFKKAFLDKGDNVV